MQLRKKKFREDLYYRIAKYVIRIPSLRDRLEDIPELVTFFLSTRFKNEITITPQAVDLLFAYHWPGNIRQLESVIETMAYRCEKKFIFRKDVPSSSWLDSLLQEPLHPFWVRRVTHWCHKKRSVFRRH